MTHLESNYKNSYDFKKAINHVVFMLESCLKYQQNPRDTLNTLTAMKGHLEVILGSFEGHFEVKYRKSQKIAILRLVSTT